MSPTEGCAPCGILRLLFSGLPRGEPPRPGILLDRDGVINRRIVNGYVTRWAEFTFLPEIVEPLVALSALPAPIIVVSNQACVAKGLLDCSGLAEITNRFVERLRGAGARIDAVYYCTHGPEHGCGCRKPQPGLLRAAARDWRLDLSRSVLAGDSPTDVQAALAVGSRAILLSRSHGDADAPSAGAVTVTDAGHMAKEILGFLSRDRSVSRTGCYGRPAI